VHIHNDDDFCKLFTALNFADKFWRIFDQKMGEISDIYIYFFWCKLNLHMLWKKLPNLQNYQKIGKKNPESMWPFQKWRNRGLDAWNYWKKPEWVEEMNTFFLSGSLLKLPIIFSHDTWTIILPACMKGW
jgi:hypothetical protein